ncbi:DUF4232 domain-containing protein [Actinoplanes xinjiangensis]|jgi:hypothetical protein|uniref:Uncharacterized protein DUF4232 n=1 Tax=Actinoplanes xinjiangensis TaxID=512350 RepID=A0A316FML5_9ACTN|nr:DUF4232 domain-containing protein [Actinoplanes xinjiangensis]PWK48960.1 uncharacterized protein DUF4232 [Actinoplanes xinjiangensis]GIF38666.1 hypothetical protein Axi01nite_29770 [Actinoplanes xinjiangensis]
MRALTTVVPGLVLLTALAACGSSGGDTAGSAPASTGATTPAGTPTASGTTSAAPAQSPGGSAGGGKSACGTQDVAVTITAQPGGDTTVRRGLVAVTNTAKSACTLRGWLFVTLVNAANEPVGPPAETVEEPGPAQDIEIRPGTTAFAGLKWTACDKADSACHVGNTIRYSLTKSTDGPAAKLDGFPAPEKSGITMKSLLIGSLQPATQGVVAW